MVENLVSAHQQFLIYFVALEGGSGDASHFFDLSSVVYFANT